MKETKAKKADKGSEGEKLSTRKEQKMAQSSKLKQQVATLQKELAELAGASAQMSTLRSEEKAAAEGAQPELKQGIRGIQLALKTLKEYYGKAQWYRHAVSGADGTISGIIALLECAEADFSKNLSEIQAEEDVAASSYEAATQENELIRITKDAGVKYKTKEAASLDKAVSELTTDIGGVQDEMVARREAEIDRLQNSLEVLESEANEAGEMGEMGETNVTVAGEAAAG